MDEWEDRLARLAGMPGYVDGLRGLFAGSLARTRPEPGAFSFVEHVWHLADLEDEGFGERIRRLLTEDEPELPDFDGARVAVERSYATRGVAEGLAAFAAARSRNVEALRRSTPSDRARCGTQEGVGRITFRELPSRMIQHDDSHRSELEALVRSLGPA